MPLGTQIVQYLLIRGYTLLGTPVVPFFPFYLGGGSLLTLIVGKRGTLIVKGLLGSLA